MPAKEDVGNFSKMRQWSSSKKTISSKAIQSQQTDAEAVGRLFYLKENTNSLLLGSKKIPLVYIRAQHLVLIPLVWISCDVMCRFDVVELPLFSVCFLCPCLQSPSVLDSQTCMQFQLSTASFGDLDIEFLDKPQLTVCNWAEKTLPN